MLLFMEPDTSNTNETSIFPTEKVEVEATLKLMSSFPMMLEMKVGWVQFIFPRMSSLSSVKTTVTGVHVIPPPALAISGLMYSRMSAVTSSSVAPAWRDNAPASTAESIAY